MTLGIMQPYFFPYLGYWQLLARVDCFVIYDNIQYTKKGWINRNRFLRNGEPAYFTVPLKQAPDRLDVGQRELAADFDREKLLRSLAGSYQRAPQFGAVFPLVERAVRAPMTNLFDYLRYSLAETAAFLGITTRVVVSSTIDIDHSLPSARRVLAICQAMGADRYLNPIGGRELYDAGTFAAQSIALEFIESRLPAYPQYAHPFVPALSIVDVLMFNPIAAARDMLRECDVTPAI